MSNFDTVGRKWEHSEYSASAAGESTPWGWWLPHAWQAVADPSGDHPVPPAPNAQTPIHRTDQGRSYAIAWWSPLLHLLFFGSGWVRPDLGLARWLELGQPQEDPVLRVVSQWWGTHLDDVLGWAGREPGVRRMAMDINDVLHIPTTGVEFPDRCANRRQSREWQNVWGEGSDSMHLTAHTLSPVWTNHAPGIHIVTEAAQEKSPRAVLMLPAYQGWYKRLHRVGAKLPVLPDGSSWRVDVVVRPLGWLGCYRRSRLTGRWFSGQHRWHELGMDAPLTMSELA
jgi:hypothetical protein